MFDHGQLIMVNSWSMIVELALDHGRPWSFRGLSTMKGPSFDHGHYMVDDGHGTADYGQPWLTMVNILDLTTIDHHVTMTIDHGRPWS